MFRRQSKVVVLIAFISLLVLTLVPMSQAQSARLFQISGPAATTITALNPDGTLVWSNALAGTNYTIQTVTSLPGGTNWVPYIQIPVTSNISTSQVAVFNPPSGMAFIPAGVFTMGNLILNGSTITNDPDITDANPTNVYVSAFYMDVNLVYSNQWRSVYSYATTHGYSFDYTGFAKAANHPVQTVDWFDCLKWCNARSQMEGLTPLYYTDTAMTRVYTNGEIAITNVNWPANGYRLPTEAEWEKAARGGLRGQRFPWGNTISESQANYYGSTGTANEPYDFGPNGYNAAYHTAPAPYTSPAGSFAPNGYGLYDMAGNVSEWCWDLYAAPPYPPGSAYLGGTDPHGPVTGTFLVIRNGAFNVGANLSRCDYRQGNNYAAASGNSIGFRCVRKY